MNRIKYLNPKTGEQRAVLVTQIANDRRVYPFKPYPKDADHKMREAGFVRANGRRMLG